MGGRRGIIKLASPDGTNSRWRSQPSLYVRYFARPPRQTDSSRTGVNGRLSECIRSERVGVFLSCAPHQHTLPGAFRRGGMAKGRESIASYLRHRPSVHLREKPKEGGVHKGRASQPLCFKFSGHAGHGIAKVCVI